MKTFKYIAVLFLFSIVLTSCRCNKEIITNETVRFEKEFIRDTIFQTVADSSTYKAWLKCDSLGNVVIASSESNSGKKLKAPVVYIKDNVLQVDCTKEAEKLFFQWKEKFKSESTSVTKEILVERELSTFQIVQIWLGRILILLIIIALVALCVRWSSKL